MDFSQVIIQILILFFLMFLGYFIRHVNVVTGQGIRDFSSLIFYVTMPALILASTGNADFSDLSGLKEMGIASAISYTFFLIMTFVLPKIVGAPEGSKGLYKFMTIFANTAFVGFPMLIAILGESTIFLAAINNIPFNILLYTVGIFFVVSDHKKGEQMDISLRKFMNPGLIATFLGLVLVLLGIKLPETIMRVSSMIGSLTTPLAMIVIGGSLYGVKLAGMLKNYRVLSFSLIKMLTFPLIIGLFLTFIGISPTVVAVSMVLAGMPIGTNTVIIVTQYEGNVLEASEAVFLSTLLMAVTAPVLVLMVNWLT